MPGTCRRVPSSLILLIDGKPQAVSSMMTQPLVILEGTEALRAIAVTISFGRAT
jgi:hypothetical protein